MTRRLLRIISALCVAVCLLTAILWATSWPWPSVVTVGSVTPPAGMSSGARWRFKLYSMRGGADVRWYGAAGAAGPVGERPRLLSASRLTRPMRLSEMSARPSVWNRLGFCFVNGAPGGTAGGPEAMVAFGVPYWFPLVACGLCLLILRLRRRSNHAKAPDAGAPVTPL